MKKKVFRIRNQRGSKGGSHHYYHADVLTTTWNAALAAAKEGRVKNWRWIDTFDKSEVTYSDFEYLYCHPWNPTCVQEPRPRKTK